MAARRLSDKDITNSLFDENGDDISDDIEDEDYIPSDDDDEIDELITDLVLYDKADDRFLKILLLRKTLLWT